MALDSSEARSRLLALAAEVFGEGAWTDEHPTRKLSSVDMMRFLVRLERQFEITVADEDLGIENFASTTAILALIQRSIARGS